MEPWSPGIWRWPWRGPVAAGVIDRTATLENLSDQLGHPAFIHAEQVHGASIASVACQPGAALTIPGCDGLTTHQQHTALLIRSADCLPIIAWDPIRHVAGVIHAGWRGLKQQLPMRLVACLRQEYQSHPEQLWVGIGPAIRECCFEVGEEFRGMFGAFVRTRGSRVTCDLIGVASDQLRRSGIKPSRIADSRCCTACHTDRWFSARKEGRGTGRLLSFVMVSA